MSSCNNCGKTILFGGRTVAGKRYCGAGCAARHPLLQMAGQVPGHVLQEYVQKWRVGACPRCRRQGPIDVYEHHRVHSFVLLTQWHTRRDVCCRRCGRRSQIGSALYSAALGWWGFPWGLLITPIQVARNLTGIFQAAPVSATPAFERVVRLQLAQNAIRNANQAPSPTPPALP